MFIAAVVSAAFYLLARRYNLLESFVDSRHDHQMQEIVVALVLLPLAFAVLVTVNWRKNRLALLSSISAERTLQGSAERYRGLFDSCTSGISRWTFEGKLVIANPAFVAMVGGPSVTAELCLSNLMDSPVATELIEDVRDGGHVGPIDMQWRVDSRVVEVRLTASLPRETEAGVFDLLTQDITSERSLESQLRHAQKMDAIGRLAGGIAHDFNNLLTVILSEAELAKDELAVESPAISALNAVIRAGERATGLTRQLLTFSRRDVVSPTVFPVDDAVTDMVRMLKRLIGDEVELTLRIGSGGSLVRADRCQFEQVVVNLVVNARDAMPHGGALVIETASRTLDEEYSAQHAGVVPGEYVMVGVSDSGLGMTRDVQERLFEPFFTTKKLGHGTGLGLATSFGIVKQAGGHIGVYSEPAIGTTMRVYLPRSGVPATAAVVPLEPPRNATPGAVILVVEDEVGVREVMTRILRRQGYVVLEASNGKDALSVMQAHPTAVDLVISDMVMPDLGGHDLADRISSEYPGVKLLFMSGYTDDILVKHHLLDGGIPFLQKPFTLSDVANVVQDALRGQRIAIVGG